MKRALSVLLLGGILAFMGGCMSWFRFDPPAPAVFELKVHVVKDTTQAVLEASGYAAREYEWDFGYESPAGTVVTTQPIVTHTFPAIGRYAVVVTAVGGAGIPGEDQGPGPGPVVPEPGSGGTRSAFAIVDFTKDNQPYPVILLLNRNNQAASFFYPFSPVTFSAAGSSSRLTPNAECSFRWRIVRIDPETGGELGYPWGPGGALLPPDPIISREMSFTVPHIPGPVDCSTPGVPRVWTFRVTLDMWDAYNNHARTEGTFQVGYP